jgi:hypothetical protein
MKIRNSPFLVLCFQFIAVTFSASGQQQVDMDRVIGDNPDLFTGSFTRIGVGFSRSNFNYATTIDGVVLNPLHFNLDLGKRINRKFGAYFTICGDILLKEKQMGFDWINQWSQAGMYLGGLFYLRGGNSYFAPEVGLGIHTFEYSEYQVSGSENPYLIGIGSMLKYGYDRHLSGKFYIGGQFYISYAYTWETDVADAVNAPTANSFIYGVAISLKFGK